MNKPSNKTAKIVRAVIIIALSIAILVLIQNIRNLIKAQRLTVKTDLEPVLTENGIDVVFDISEASQSKYSVENGVVYALSDNKDILALWIELSANKDDSYNTDTTPITNIVEGSGNWLPVKFPNVFGEPFYVTAFPLHHTDLQKLPVLNLEKIKVYDNYGNSYFTQRAPTLYLFYYTRNDPLPEDFKLFIEYEGNEYLIYDNSEWQEDLINLINNGE